MYWKSKSMCRLDQSTSTTALTFVPLCYSPDAAVGESEASWTITFHVYCPHTIHIGKINECIYKGVCCLFMLPIIHK